MTRPNRSTHRGKRTASLFLALIAGSIAFYVRERVAEFRQPTQTFALSDQITDTQFLHRQLSVIATGGSPKVTQHAYLANAEYHRSLQAAVDRLAETRSYDADDLRTGTATVVHIVTHDPAHEIAKAAWEAKWKSKLAKYEVTGGCGCCTEDYTITGPRAAILEYPLTQPNRNWIPNKEQ